MAKSLRIAVDFDGTCVVQTPMPGHGSDMPEAVETLQELAAAGHKLILWTCRVNHPTDPDNAQLDIAVRWFRDRNIPLAAVNENLPFTKEEWLWWNDIGGPRKVFADVYIEDKLPGGFPGWRFVREQILG